MKIQVMLKKYYSSRRKRQNIIKKMEHYIISKLLNDSTVSRFVNIWYSDSYSMISESLWNYYKTNKNNAANNRISKNKKNNK